MSLNIEDLNDDDVFDWDTLQGEKLIKAKQFREILGEASSSILPSTFIAFLDKKDLSIHIDKEATYNSAISQMAKYPVWIFGRNSWFQEGVDCKILRVGASGWQKGKVRVNVSVEFIPEEISEEAIQTTDRGFNAINYADSSLDEIRQMKIEE